MDHVRSRSGIALGEGNHVVSGSVREDDRHRAPHGRPATRGPRHGSDGGDTIAQRTPECGRERASVGESRYEDPAPIDAQVGLDAIEDLSSEPDVVGERWIVDRLEVEIGWGRSFEVGPLWEDCNKNPSARARAARPDLRAWSSLELVKPGKLNASGIATPCAVPGTTMSYASIGGGGGGGGGGLSGRSSRRARSAAGGFSSS